jgi:hypothetical protein
MPQSFGIMNSWLAKNDGPCPAGSAWREVRSRVTVETDQALICHQNDGLQTDELPWEKSF